MSTPSNDNSARQHLSLSWRYFYLCWLSITTRVWYIPARRVRCRPHKHWMLRSSWLRSLLLVFPSSGMPQARHRSEGWYDINWGSFKVLRVAVPIAPERNQHFILCTRVKKANRKTWRVVCFWEIPERFRLYAESDRLLHPERRH